jgi:chemotaxis protein methyltransferase CheR
MIQGTPRLTREELDSFIAMLTQNTGIIPRSSHLEGIKNYIEKQLEKKGISVVEYKNKLVTDKKLFSELINESTVNETYFFREEKQFLLLRDKIFPIWKATSSTLPIKIWSAACSFGEEAYSLALLAKNCGVNAIITASDINSQVLEHCKSGIFKSSSIRSVDGSSFKDLLTPYQNDGKIQFDSEIKNCISAKEINLSKIEEAQTQALLPKNQHIVFLRNVFIYFSQNLRLKILNAIAEKCLADNGILFVSMNETAQINFNEISPLLEKVMDGSIFYFKKKSLEVKANG